MSSTPPLGPPLGNRPNSAPPAVPPSLSPRPPVGAPPSIGVPPVGTPPVPSPASAPAGLTIPTSTIGAPGRQNTTQSSTVQFVSAPLKWLYTAQILVVLGIIISLLPLLTDLLPALVFTLVGWALCAFGGLGMAAIFIRKDAQAQSSPFYVFRTSTRAWYTTTLILALTGIVVCAAHLALVVGRI